MKCEKCNGKGWIVKVYSTTAESMICDFCNGKIDINWLESIFGVRTKRVFYENGQYADFNVDETNS